MAATYHQGGLPLQAIVNRASDFCSPFRLPVQGNRKSAVELLQETKCLYVKSNTVLAARQDLSEPVSIKSCLEEESARPKLVALRRSNISACSDQLQAKLRKLLNVDSKENLQENDNCENWRCDRVSTSGCKSLPDLTTAKDLSLTPTRGKPGRRKSSGDGMTSHVHHLSSSSTIRGVTYSTGDLSEDESQTNESSSSSIASSSSKSYGKPPSLGSVSLGGSTSKVEIRKEGVEIKGSVEWEGETVDVIPRSKSDLAWSEPPTDLTESQVLFPASLDDFFTYLGLGQSMYSMEIEKNEEQYGVYFSSGDSSVESGSPRRRINRRHNPETSSTSGSSDSGSRLRSQTLSIVERNARVIKWICNCNKTNS